MCRNFNKHFLTSAIILSTVSPAFAQLTATNNASQANENLPYSRYGIGEQRNGVNTILKQMGSISSAYANPFAVNTDNPASYAAVRLTTYEAGGEGVVRNAMMGSDKYRTGTATLSYLNVGLPLSKNGGLAFGLRPYSRTRYNMRGADSIAGLGTVVENYLGDGSINYGFIGAGYKFKNFSLGANFGYLFGTIDNRNLLVPDSFYSYASAVTRSAKIGGIYWKAGAQYEAKLKEKLSLRLGATATLSQSLNVSQDEYWISFWSGVGSSEFSDTVYANADVKSKITLPLSYSFGAHLVGGSNWMVGADLTVTQWSQFRKFDKPDPAVTDQTFRIAVGGEYTPDPADTRSYFQRVTYRLGFNYGTENIRLRNTDMNYYAVTGGVSLPFKRSTDRIHLSLEGGSRGTTVNGLVKENFLRFGVGITLNDRWFIKRKYD
ncbi:MAG: hypothetical protein EOP56_06155 [Sphingobacteriales bacterium]|nr:MAG: hypothetical protein EOP56_06155 [Sphingobacteriales bacterium]